MDHFIVEYYILEKASEGNLLFSRNKPAGELVQLMQHKGLLSSQQGEISSSCESKATLSFSRRLGQQALMQRASHNGPGFSTYIIKSPLQWPAQNSLEEALSGHIFHISLKRTTPLSQNPPRRSRYSLKSPHPVSFHQHFTLTRSASIAVKLVLSHWLSHRKSQSLYT